MADGVQCGHTEPRFLGRLDSGLTLYGCAGCDHAFVARDDDFFTPASLRAQLASIGQEGLARTFERFVATNHAPPLRLTPFPMSRYELFDELTGETLWPRPQLPAKVESLSDEDLLAYPLHERAPALVAGSAAQHELLTFVSAFLAQSCERVPHDAGVFELADMWLVRYVIRRDAPGPISVAVRDRVVIDAEARCACVRAVLLPSHVAIRVEPPDAILLGRRCEQAVTEEPDARATP